MRREMSQVMALVHKVKGTFRRNDPFVKYMDRIVSTADSHAADTRPSAVELDDDVDTDFFDRQDLGVLNRRLRKVSLQLSLSTCFARASLIAVTSMLFKPHTVHMSYDSKLLCDSIVARRSKLQANYGHHHSIATEFAHRAMCHVANAMPDPPT